MSKVYLLNKDGMTDSMSQVICKDEGKELQELLEKNPDLLPGEQINPEDPRHWFLIKREMPVNDPGTGGERWSVDFFFVDQEGIPTFVECKRFKDTRSRREVVGQMLEYAANGQFYWTKDTVRDSIVNQTKGNLDEFIQSIESEGAVSSDDFFEQIENNLREGQIRLIFFLEEAPYELKSIVDFLNKQMERTEVLIVEAKQYEQNDLRIIVPRLFGYTEQARRIKKKTNVVPKRRKWDEAEFFNDAKKQLSSDEVEAINRIYNFVVSKGYSIKWGTGIQTGSCLVSDPRLLTKSIFSVCTDGKLWLNFGWLQGDPTVEKFRDAFANAAKDKLGISIPSDYTNRFLSIDIKHWGPRVETFIKLLSELSAKYLRHKTPNGP